MAYIYKILNKVNGKFYIGSATDFRKRWYQHKYELNKNIHQNPYLQNAWSKYGEGNFEFIVLESNISEENKYEIEQEYLDNLQPFNNVGYNISKTAQGGGTYGSKIHTSIYTEEQIIQLKKLIIENKLTIDELSRITGINKNNIYQIRNCTNWANIGSEFNDEMKDVYESTIKRKQKWKDEYYQDVIKMYENGIKPNKIAEKYGLSESRVSKKIKDFYAIKGGYFYICEVCHKSIIMDMILTRNRLEFKPKTYRKPKYCKECAKKVKNNKNKQYRGGESDGKTVPNF